jgi:hypothetical protein
MCKGLADVRPREDLGVVASGRPEDSANALAKAFASLHSQLNFYNPVAVFVKCTELTANSCHSKENIPVRLNG